MEAFNQHTSAEFPELKKARELVEGKPYLIVNMRRVNTKFGNAIVTELKNEEDGNSNLFSIFLPQRFVRALVNVDLSLFCDGAHQLVFQNIQNKSPDVEMRQKSSSS